MEGSGGIRCEDLESGIGQSPSKQHPCKPPGGGHIGLGRTVAAITTGDSENSAAPAAATRSREAMTKMPLDSLARACDNPPQRGQVMGTDGEDHQTANAEISA